jgi:hypothetical protein
MGSTLILFDYAYSRCQQVLNDTFLDDMSIGIQIRNLWLDHRLIIELMPVSILDATFWEVQLCLSRFSYWSLRSPMHHGGFCSLTFWKILMLVPRKCQSKKCSPRQTDEFSRTWPEHVRTLAKVARRVGFCNALWCADYRIIDCPNLPLVTCCKFEKKKHGMTPLLISKSTTLHWTVESRQESVFKRSPLLSLINNSVFA